MPGQRIKTKWLLLFHRKVKPLTDVAATDPEWKTPESQLGTTTEKKEPPRPVVLTNPDQAVSRKQE